MPSLTAKRGPVRPLALLVALTVARFAAAQHPLHYRFTPGDQLVYEIRTTTTAPEADEPRADVTEHVQVWCLQRGEAEVLLLVAAVNSGGPTSKPLVGLPFYVDDAGRPRWPDEVPSRAGDLETALLVLPRLPLAVETDTFWLTAPDLWGQQWRCRSRGPLPEPHPAAIELGSPAGARLCVEFTAEDSLGIAGTLGLEGGGRFWFDPSQGCLTRLEFDQTSRLRDTRTHVVAVLRQKLTHPPDWASRRADEAQRFLRSFRHEDRLLHELALRGEELPQTVEQLDRLWAAFKSDVDVRAGSPLADLADARRQWLRAGAEILRTRAVLGRRWMNQPARPWSLQDPNGRTLTSETAHRGVVIECFWSAESIWGLRALESFRRVQARAATGVRVLCFNMDSDPALATLAIQHCGGGLTHVLAGPLQDAESLTELPVVRVLDAHGIVRDLWIGWQPDYAAAGEMARALATSPR